MTESWYTSFFKGIFLTVLKSKTKVSISRSHTSQVTQTHKSATASRQQPAVRGPTPAPSGQTQRRSTHLHPFPLSTFSYSLWNVIARQLEADLSLVLEIKQVTWPGPSQSWQPLVKSPGFRLTPSQAYSTFTCPGVFWGALGLAELALHCQSLMWVWMGLGKNQAKYSESGGFTWLPKDRSPLQTAHGWISKAKASGKEVLLPWALRCSVAASAPQLRHFEKALTLKRPQSTQPGALSNWDGRIPSSGPDQPVWLSHGVT